MAETKQNRQLEPDIARALAIIAVVLGHCIQCGNGKAYYDELLFLDNIGYKIIYGFHMPILMLISGYFFGISIKKSAVKMIGDRFIALVLPILSWEFLVTIRHILAQPIGSWIVEYGESVLQSFWFLWAVLFASLWSVLAEKVLGGRLKLLIYLIGVIATFVTPDMCNSECYKFMYVFFLLGIMICEKKLIEKIYTLKWTLIMIAAAVYAVGLILYSRDAYIYTTGWTLVREDFATVGYQLLIDLYRIGMGILGSLVVLSISRKIAEVIIRTEVVRKLVSAIGQNTLGIYIISIYMNSVLLKLTANVQPNALITVVETIAITAGSTVVAVVITKIPFIRLMLLGKRMNKKGGKNG